MSNTTRMNISVPVALREQMDARSGVNWSAVAAEAFRELLSDRCERTELNANKGADCRA